MKAELVLFGKHFNMASRARRRRLVILFYAAFAALILATWLVDSSGYGSSFFTFQFTILVGPILGGYLCGWFKPFKTGLVRPSFGNEMIVRYSARKSRSVLSKRFFPEEDFPEIRNDERDLNQRDHVHFLAYRVLALLIMLAFFLQFTESAPFFHKHIAFWTSFGITTIVLQHLTLVLLQTGYILTLTLPPAIVLWCEPNLELPNEG
jgi:hypothetical protein